MYLPETVFLLGDEGHTPVGDCDVRKSVDNGGNKSVEELWRTDYWSDGDGSVTGSSADVLRDWARYEWESSDNNFEDQVAKVGRP